ncbi:MAG TPA: aldolase, partial [Nocardioides sp.]|nr:aldolase [Nocardioides sp.]
MTRPRLTAADLAEVERVMAPADAALARHYPEETVARQPVHTLYVPADRVAPGVVTGLGAAARAALDAHAPDPAALARALGADPDGVAAVWPLLLEKLDREPVEDLRIDFEDGYRGHSDTEEDAHAVAAVRAV